MTFKLRILGVDPSLNNFGMALLDIRFNKANTHVDTKVLTIDLVRTQKSISDFERAKIINRQFKKLAARSNVVIAELPAGARSARAGWTLGIVTGIIACSIKPIVTVTPRQVKQVTGKSTATKDDVFAWADAYFNNVGWYSDASGTPYKYNTHIADALAAVMAGIAYKRKEVINGTTLPKKN